MREVAVIGVGMTKFGELWDSSFRDIGLKAGMLAIEDAGLSGDEIDGMFIGNMASGRFIDQHHIGALIADYSGMASNHVPATRVEAGGASGGMAFRQGVMAVASGMHDMVIVGGAEKMTDVDDPSSNAIIDSTADQQWESSMGATMASLHAMIAKRCIHEGMATREEIAAVSVNSHANAVDNPNAQFRRATKIESVIRSSAVAEPLGMFDCAPISDGAAAVVLCPLEDAKKHTDKPVKVAAVSQASDTLALFQRNSILSFAATRVAAERAYARAGISAKDVSVAEVHDNYTISGILAAQDLGLFKKGEAGKAFLEGVTLTGGKMPINTSGGLKAQGHPIGATGVAQIVELTHQMRGTADKRQIAKPRYGLAQNVGGTGSAVTVSILEAI
ncbi:MAG: thiolase domain-containing protein [Thermoplasmatales archaeon]|nr:thiolase domain-containing protein [Thermoplasmatales archaeon]